MQKQCIKGNIHYHYNSLNVSLLDKQGGRWEQKDPGIIKRQQNCLPFPEVQEDS